MSGSGLPSGTLIRTPGGDVPIEALVEGEMVVASDGNLVPIVWLGRRRHLADPRAAATPPVRILRGAVADDVPARDLVVAPDHCLWIERRLIPARLLVNGASIDFLAGPPPVVTFSIELRRPDLVLAEGMAVESYRDQNDRSLYVNAPATASPAAASPAAEPCAPLCLAGADLVAIHARLLARAPAAGCRRTTDPGLHLLADGIVVVPEASEGGRYRFALPPGAREIRLASRSFVPSQQDRAANDHRRLGVPVVALRVRAEGHEWRDLPLDPPPSGFHAAADAEGGVRWRWTNGEALLPQAALEGASTLTVDLNGENHYWLTPPPAGPAASPAAEALDRAEAARLRLLWVSGEAHTPGHTYRVLRPMAAAQRLGHHAAWLRSDETAAHLDALRAADVVVLWRCRMSPALREAIAAARKGKAALLFDVDDLMIDPLLARADIIDAIRSEKHDPVAVRAHFGEVAETLTQCDAALTTTRELGLHIQACGKPAHLLPNGYDDAMLRRARAAVRRRAADVSDGLIRLGYAGGSRTHQRDFALVADAVARILHEDPHCRLVLFREPTWDARLVEVAEYPALAEVADRIEWRDMVELAALPEEIARFDINLAPLEVGNLFCEAKSELKFFEAALAGACTVASPTGPFVRAIRDGEIGLLAATPADWYAALRKLVNDGPLRRRLATAAYHDVLWMFGPERRAELLADILAQLRPGREAARGFELQMHRTARPRTPQPHVPEHAVLFSVDHGGEADVTIVIPLYNYAQYVREALDTSWHQTVATLDLVVIDDRSTDHSLQVVTDWVKRYCDRFNRVLILQNLVNSGLGLSRNAGFAAAETPYILPLDADNRIMPHCAERCLEAARAAQAAFAYPEIMQFGTAQDIMGRSAFQPARFAAGNYIDAMALVSKVAWAAAGGYHRYLFGWEDFDFWCRLVERGMWGVPVPHILAEYRVHPASMLHTVTEVKNNKRRVAAEMTRLHPWVCVEDILNTRALRDRLVAKPVPKPRRKASHRSAEVTGTLPDGP